MQAIRHVFAEPFGTVHDATALKKKHCIISCAIEDLI
jgi:hypothetical protein